MCRQSGVKDLLPMQERHVRATWQLISDTATALFTAPEE